MGDLLGFYAALIMALVQVYECVWIDLIELIVIG